MNRKIIYIILIIIQFIGEYKNSFGQIQNDCLAIDSTQALSGIVNYLDIYETKWLTIGAKHDFVNSTFGLEISNGYNERPLIHFEDFSEGFVFKLQGQTDLDKDYSFGINAGWKNLRYISLIAIEFQNYDYQSKVFKLQKLNITAETYIKNTDIALKLKLAHQRLNLNDNIGAEIGLHYILIYQKLYAGVTAGSYFDYFTYSGFMKSFIYRKIIGMEVTYEKIEKYDFLNLGLTFTFKR